MVVTVGGRVVLVGVDQDLLKPTFPLGFCRRSTLVNMSEYLDPGPLVPGSSSVFFEKSLVHPLRLSITTLKKQKQEIGDSSSLSPSPLWQWAGPVPCDQCSRPTVL